MPRRGTPKDPYEGLTRSQRNNMRAEAVGFSSYYEYRKVGKDPTYNAMMDRLTQFGPWERDELRSLSSWYNVRVNEIGIGRMAVAMGIDPETGVLEEDFPWHNRDEIFGDSPPA